MFLAALCLTIFTMAFLSLVWANSMPGKALDTVLLAKLLKATGCCLLLAWAWFMYQVMIQIQIESGVFRVMGIGVE